MIEEWQYTEKNLRINERESQIIIGTLLGTSSIIFPKKSKNPHLLMRSTKKNPTWIRCKAYELKRFSRPKSFIEDQYSFRWNSISTELLMPYYDLFYKKNNKEISLQTLESLRPLSICCLFLDRGFINDFECGFKMNEDKKSNKNILKYFCLLDLPLIESKNNYIFSDKKNVSKFFNIIKNHIPNEIKKNILNHLEF